MTNRRSVVAVGVCLCAALAIVRADSSSFAYTEIILPNALSATAQGINARGDVVGIYRDGAVARTRGFLWTDGEATPIDYPGAAVTEARGISATGEIVGTYRIAGEPPVNVHGFLLKKDGTFENVDFPGHTNTIAQRILPNGIILGCRHDHDMMNTMRGVIMRPDGTSAEIDEFASMHNGATPDGQLIVGLFTNMMTGRGEGYVIDDGVFTPFVVPGSNFTTAWDVNPRGEIVGVYRDAGNKIHGYVRDGDDYMPIDMPGANATRVFGINASGDVVGAFVDSAGRTRAFVATRTHGR